MKSSPHVNPDRQGSLSQENAPRVVVRAGKYFVCSSCGTMVEIPADVVGKMVLVLEQYPPGQAEPRHPSAESSSTDNPPPIVVANQPAPTTRRRTVPTSAPSASSAARAGSSPRHSSSPGNRPARPERPRRPGPASFAGRLIDGLRVPSGQELDRALAWVTFHLQVIDRQVAEIQRLKKLLKQRPVPARPPSSSQAENRQIPADTAPGPNPVMQRGPPS